MKRTIGLVTAVALSGAAYAQDVKVGGYADGGWMWQKDGVTAFGTSDESAFYFNEGSATLDATSGNTTAHVRLLLSPYGVPAGSGNSVHFSRYQLSTKYDNGFSWRAGLVDGLLGAESQYSNQRYFSERSVVSSAFKAAYAGIVMGYSMGDSLNFEFAVANDSTENNLYIHDPLIGLKLTSNMGDITAFAGAEFQKDAGETGYAIDVGAHAKMGNMHFGAELAMTKAAVANADSGFGFGIHGGFEVMEGTEILARFDWGNENFAVDGYDLTFGPSFKMTDAMVVRAHYTMSKRGDADAGHMASINSVFTF